MAGTSMSTATIVLTIVSFGARGWAAEIWSSRLRSGSAHLDRELAVAVDAEAEAGKRGGLASPDKSRGTHLACKEYVIFGGRIFQTRVFLPTKQPGSSA